MTGEMFADLMNKLDEINKNLLNLAVLLKPTEVVVDVEKPVKKRTRRAQNADADA